MPRTSLIDPNATGGEEVGPCLRRRVQAVDLAAERRRRRRRAPGCPAGSGHVHGVAREAEHRHLLRRGVDAHDDERVGVEEALLGAAGPRRRGGCSGAPCRPTWGPASACRGRRRRGPGVAWRVGAVAPGSERGRGDGDDDLVASGRRRRRRCRRGRAPGRRSTRPRGVRPTMTARTAPRPASPRGFEPPPGRPEAAAGRTRASRSRSPRRGRRPRRRRSGRRGRRRRSTRRPTRTTGWMRKPSSSDR